MQRRRPPVWQLLLAAGLLAAAAGCGSRGTTPALDAGLDGRADAVPVGDGLGADGLGSDAPAADAPAADAPAADAPPADAPPALDAGWDATIVVPDAGAPTTSCAAAGGLLCTPYRWEICPVGTEPVSGADPHRGCGQGGWCCQAAPPSTCSQSGQGNCVPGACTGCWYPVSGLTCEAGRVCCQDYCD